MNISQEKDKIREIIRRSSIRNYFTPLLPKHSDKPKLSKYSRILLRCPEPKNLTSNSPVSIKNYKNIPVLTPIGRDSSLNLSRKISQISANKLNYSIEIPGTIHQLLSPSRKSTDNPLSIKYESTPDRAKKNYTSFEINEFREDEAEEEFKVIYPPRIIKKDEKFLNISRVNCEKKYKKIGKSPLRVKDAVQLPKYVSTGENTDDTSIHGWDYSNELLPE